MPKVDSLSTYCSPFPGTNPFRRTGAPPIALASIDRTALNLFHRGQQPSSLSIFLAPASSRVTLENIAIVQRSAVSTGLILSPVAQPSSFTHLHDDVSSHLTTAFHPCYVRISTTASSFQSFPKLRGLRHCLQLSHIRQSFSANVAAHDATS